MGCLSGVPFIPAFDCTGKCNVPMTLKGMPVKQARSRSKELIKKVGLGEKQRSSFPQMMSGGEQQRVAIARAGIRWENLIGR